MTTTAKVLQVLKLFNDSRKQLKATDVETLLGVSPATAYRYIADLEEAGLVERTTIGHYVLGPTIVELDRLIRENDPLIDAARDVMKGLVDRTGGVALLSRLHGKKVVCVHQIRGKNGPPQVSYERGRAMPLFKGATSKIILSCLSREELGELVNTEQTMLRAAGLPQDVEGLWKALDPIRQRRVCRTSGEVDRDAKGCAAAIHQGRHVIGSLSIVLWAHAPNADEAKLEDLVLRSALRIEGRMG